METSHNPETNYLLELRRSKIVDFETVLGEHYKQAVAEQAAHFSDSSKTIAIIEGKNVEKLLICCDEFNDMHGQKHYNYWLSRVKSKKAQNGLKKSAIILPNRDDGTLVKYTYSQKNPYLGNYVWPNEVKTEVFDDLEVLETVVETLAGFELAPFLRAKKLYTEHLSVLAKTKH